MRLFFALQLPDPAREALRPALEAARAQAPQGVGFTRLEQLHYTLVFLGETDRVDDAVAAAEPVRALPQFELGVGGRGAFPRVSKPRVLWLGATEGGPALTGVANLLAAGLRERNFRLEERDFQPHLTLGRVKPRGDREARRALEAVPRGELARFPAREIALMSSELGPDGAKHTLLRAFPLAPISGFDIAGSAP